MKKSASISIPSESDIPLKDGRIDLWGLLVAAFLIIAVSSYCAPWVHGSGASTSLTGYDLAEWTSLVPGVRYGERPMVLPGLLRAHLLFLAALVALAPTRRGSVYWWAAGAAALILSAAQLPPFEYFLERSWQVDVNYGQQVTLALLTVVDAAVCWILPRGGGRRIAVLLFVTLGLIAAYSGTAQALQMVASFSVPATIGIGVVGYCAALTGLGVVVLSSSRRSMSKARSA
ncbi:MAG: hypothetical protein KA401_03660 [Anaerolineae bacterium]|nr:hypothetical protein [Chloroflexota bacterium]MBP6298420.1 hypothetical protein [Anaerolineae bacterium]